MLKQFFVLFLVLLGTSGVVYSDGHDNNTIFPRYGIQRTFDYDPSPRQLFPDLGTFAIERIKGYPCYCCAPCLVMWCLSGSCPAATVLQVSLVACLCKKS